MKKYFSLFVIAFAIILTGCSSKSTTFVITTDDAEDIGDVYGSNDFFEPVPGTYTISAEENALSTTIDFKIVRRYENPDYIVEKFILEAKDKEGRDIEINHKDVEFAAENMTSAYKDLISASIGDVVKVKFTCILADSKQVKEVLQSFASCDIELHVDEPEEEDFLSALERDILEAEADLDDEDMENSGSSEDWDAILDSYESYMDQYIKVLKKVNAGDANAYSEMMSLMQECNELNEKLSSANDNMSVAQATRFQKIAAKMASAAAQM